MRATAIGLAACGGLLVIYAAVMRLAGHAQLSVGVGVLDTPMLAYLGTFLALLAAVMLLARSAAHEPLLSGNKRGAAITAAVVLVGLALLVLARPLSSTRVPADEQALIDAFHRLYFATAPYERATFLGVSSQQYPVDNWTMQELITTVRPERIVETGTASGGTALYYAMLLEQLGDDGVVVTTDLQPFDATVESYPVWRERVIYIPGNCVSREVSTAIAAEVDGKRTMVTLDTNHKKEHVLKELELYAPLVSVGSYLVVQDTHLGGHPNHHADVPDEGPWEAVEEFLKRDDSFELDRSWESHLITQNPRGYLRRVR